MNTSELHRKYRAALTQLRKVQRLRDDARLQAQLAATILSGNSEMQPQDAVDLAFMILDAIVQQRAEDVEMRGQLLRKAKATRRKQK